MTNGSTHRACQCAMKSPWLRKLTVAKRLQKSQWGFINVATRRSSGHRSELVEASLLSMHKRVCAADCGGRQVTAASWKSLIILFWSQIGFKYSAIGFIWNLALKVMQLCYDLSASVQRLAGNRVVNQKCNADWSAAHRRLIGYLLVFNRRLVNDRLQGDLQRSSMDRRMFLNFKEKLFWSHNGHQQVSYQFPFSCNQSPKSRRLTADCSLIALN